MARMFSRYWRAIALISLLAAGCGHAMGAANFSGMPQPVLVPPEQIRDELLMPPGYESIGEVSLDCRDMNGSCFVIGDTLDSCDMDRMITALKDEASRVGGELLVQRRCDTDEHESSGCAKVREHSETMRCRAVVARRVKPGTGGSTNGVPNSQLPPALRANAQPAQESALSPEVKEATRP